MDRSTTDSIYTILGDVKEKNRLMEHDIVRIMKMQTKIMKDVDTILLMMKKQQNETEERFTKINFYLIPSLVFVSLGIFFVILYK